MRSTHSYYVLKLAVKLRSIYTNGRNIFYFLLLFYKFYVVIIYHEIELQIFHLSIKDGHTNMNNKLLLLIVSKKGYLILGGEREF